MSWTLEEAIEYIRKIQPIAMDRGFCLMIGGGVLNRGRSDNDLDLLAYPRTLESRKENLVSLWPSGKWSSIDVADIYTVTLPDKIEIIFQKVGVT